MGDDDVVVELWIVATDICIVKVYICTSVRIYMYIYMYVCAYVYTSLVTVVAQASSWRVCILPLSVMMGLSREQWHRSHHFDGVNQLQYVPDWGPLGEFRQDCRLGPWPTWGLVTCVPYEIFHPPKFRKTNQKIKNLEFLGFGTVFFRLSSICSSFLFGYISWFNDF